jgi:succinate dehydrogenase/fumarate reductase-like Fe-S protein
MKFRIYRYDPEKDAKPYVQDYDVALDPHDRMLLDALIRVKASTTRCRSAGAAARASAAPTR